MANSWNPNAPGALGLEWFPTVGDIQGTEHNLSTDGPLALRLRSKATETIDTVTLRQKPDSLATSGYLSLLEVYPSGSEVPGGAATSTFQPDADGAAGAWVNQAASGANLFQSIDDLALNTIDYIEQPSTSVSVYRFQINSAAFSLASRVERVTLRIWAACSQVGNTRQLTVGVRSGGVNYQALLGSLTLTSTIQEFDVSLGEIEPGGQFPWTPTDIRNFDTATLEFFVSGAATSKNRPRIYMVSVDVATCTETRTAVGISAATGSKPLDASHIMRTPAGVDNWAKVNATDYTLVFRDPEATMTFLGSTIATWHASVLGGIEQRPPIPGLYGVRVKTSGGNRLTSIDTTVRNSRIPSIILATTAPAVSNDSQPYVYLNRVTVGTGQTAEQEITPGATTNYLVHRFLASPNDASAGPLVVKIKRRSDNVQFGATVTITADDALALADNGLGLRLISLVMASAAALVNGTQYYIEFSMATVDTYGWVVVELDAFGSGAGASFGGLTDVATYAASEDASTDLVAQLLSQPAAPSGVGGVVVRQSLPGNGLFCTADDFDVVRISWTATALGASFSYYEIQRSDDGRVTWFTVAQPTPEATVSFDDLEAKRNVLSEYRIRVVRIDGAFSAWVETASFRPVSRGCEMLFVSNDAPTLAAAYDRDPSIAYTFLAFDGDVIVPIYGADYQAVFSELEDRGVEFSARLVLNFGQSPADGSLAMFDPLKDILRADIPYVCVLDWLGNRWFAHVQITAATHDNPGWEYHATIHVIEVTGTPAIVDP